MNEQELISQAMRALARRSSEKRARAARANGARGGRPRKRLSATVEQVIACMCREPMADIHMDALHEAGHLMAWRILWPSAKVACTVREGRPCVAPEGGDILREIATMACDDAMRLASIKVSGYVAEMVEMGIENATGELAEALADDYVARRPRLDWDDMLSGGDDIGDAVRILVARGGRPALAANLMRALDNARLCLIDRESWRREAESIEAMLRAWSGARGAK